jgi:hypothetical protein
VELTGKKVGIDGQVAYDCSGPSMGRVARGLLQISQIPRKLNSGEEDEKTVCATGTLGDDTHGSGENGVRLYVEFD